MDRYKIIDLLEIAFWKMMIHLMSLSRSLLALAQPGFDSLVNEHTKNILWHSAILAGSGLALGFALGFLRTILR